MSEVKRYKVDDFRLDNPTTARTHLMVHAELFDTQRLRADTAEAERDGAMAANAVLREEVRTERHRANAAVGDANEAERKLAAAEQRIAELEADKARIDWLEEQSVDTLYLDDGRIIDIAGRIDLRKAIDNAIDAALNPNPEAESHE